MNRRQAPTRRFELLLPGGPTQGGFLIVRERITGGAEETVQIKLSPSMVAVVWSLLEAKRKDIEAGLEPAGWRGKVLLAREISRLRGDNRGSDGAEAIVRLVFRVNKEVSKELGTEFKLIESLSSIGYRLKYRVGIIDQTQTPREEGPSHERRD